MRPLQSLYRRLAVAFSFLFLLAACGSGTTSTSVGTGTSNSVFTGGTSVNPVVSLPDYASLMGTRPTASEVDGIIPDITALGDAGAANQIFRGRPNTSFARYNGIIVADLSATQVVAGRLNMNVDFSNSTFTADADNFTQFNTNFGVTTYDEDLSGSFRVPTGFVIGNAFGGTGSGTLTGTNGPTDVDATLDGIFIDNGGQNIAMGTIDGTFTNTVGTFNFGGGLLATDR